MSRLRRAWFPDPKAFRLVLRPTTAGGIVAAITLTRYSLASPYAAIRGSHAPGPICLCRSHDCSAGAYRFTTARVLPATPACPCRSRPRHRKPGKPYRELLSAFDHIAYAPNSRCRTHFAFAQQTRLRAPCAFVSRPGVRFLGTLQPRASCLTSFR